MSIKTINRKILHRQNPAFDEQRFAAFEESADMFMAEIVQELREEYITSHLPMLQMLDNRITGMIVCGNLVVIQWIDHIEYADTTGMDRACITQALIRAVSKRMN